MSDHHAEGFRPSHFGALSKCIHHRNKPGQSEAAGRGTGKHTEFASLAQIIMVMGQDTRFENISPEALWAGELILGYVKEGWRVFAVEQLVDILDENGQKISQGTIDLVLERNGEYLIIDWKTGDKGDYDMQLRAYALAWMDLHPMKCVSSLIGYVDLRETQEVNVNWELASASVLDLWDRWSDPRRKNQPYVINGFCDYCGLRGECPAWAREATAAFDKVNYLTLNPQTGLPQGGNLAPAAVVGLKNDPERLEAFLTAWERAKTLVEEDWALKEALKTHMETGFKAANHILVNRKATKEVEKRIGAEAFLHEVAKEIGFARAAQAITVNVDKAIQVWDDFNNLHAKEHSGVDLGPPIPFPVDIQEIVIEKPGYSYVRAKGKPGAGDARKKRKELE